MVFSNSLRVCLLLAITLAASAQEKEIQPTVPFQAAEAGAYFQGGKATLRGYVSEKRHNGANTLNNIHVVLFPYTSYFQAYEQLLEHHDRDVRPLMSAEAYSYRIETIASNQDGSFEFRDLKPGRYYITCLVTVNKVGYYDVQTGTETIKTTTLMNGQPIGENTREVPIYTTYSEIYNTRQERHKLVEVESNAQLVEVEL